jgi:hypothetical protein
MLLALEQGLAQGQSCSVNDEMLNTKGIWKHTEDFMWPGRNYKPEMKPEIYKRLNNIQQILQKAYPDPKGMQVNWKRDIMNDPPLSKLGSVGYSLGVLAMELFCDKIKLKIMQEDETSNILDIYVNNLGGYFHFDTTMRIGNLYVALMYHRVGKIADVDLFQTSLVRGNERFIIISRNGELPYTPLTRKQYLTALKTKLKNQENYQLDGIARNNQTDQQKQQGLQWTRSHIDPKIKMIDDYLSSATEDDLNQPAFVKDMMEFKKFYSEKDGGMMPVIINKSYFNNTLNPIAPQFMLMRWEWNDGEGPPGGLLRPQPPDMDKCCRISKYYKESIEKNLEVEALRQLLDK